MHVPATQLKLRLKTLVDKKKVIQSRSWKSSKLSTIYITLREGFQQFEHDLSKLQLFVEVNATAFSKILKKVGFVLCVAEAAAGGVHCGIGRHRGRMLTMNLWRRCL